MFMFYSRQSVSWQSRLILLADCQEKRTNKCNTVEERRFSAA
jgi:hypothetical protein